MAYHVEKIDIQELHTQWESLLEFHKKGDLSHYPMAMQIVETVSDIANTVNDVIKKWDNDLEQNLLDYEGMPNSVLKYIEKLLYSGQIKSPKDIIALFEAGELQGIVKADNSIDQTALAAFEQKMGIPLVPAANTNDDEDIF